MNRYHFETLHEIVLDEHFHPWKFVLALLALSFVAGGLIVVALKLWGVID